MKIGDTIWIVMLGDNIAWSAGCFAIFETEAEAKSCKESFYGFPSYNKMSVVQAALNKSTPSDDLKPGDILTGSLKQ